MALRFHAFKSSKNEKKLSPKSKIWRFYKWQNLASWEDPVNSAPPDPTHSNSLSINL